MGSSFSECSNTNSTNLAFHLSSDLRLLMSIYSYYHLQKGLTTIHWSCVYSSHPSSRPFCFRHVGWNYQQHLHHCHARFWSTVSVWYDWRVFTRCASTVRVMQETCIIQRHAYVS